MKRSPTDISSEKQALIYAGSGLLILIAVHSTLGAVVSAFALPVSMSSMFWYWMIGTIIVTTVTAIYRSKGLLILIIPAFILFLFSYESIVDGGMWVINTVTLLYGKWLPVTELFPEIKKIDVDPSAFIAALGILLMFLLAFSICLRRSVFITILITAPLIFLTFVITDLQADLIYIFGILAVYLTLLISSAYSPDDFIKRGLISIPAFAIAIAIMIIAYMFAPRGSYTREDHIAALGNRFRFIASQMGSFGQFWSFGGSGNWGYSWHGNFEGGVWYFNTQTVNIANAGARIFTDQSLLEVTANEAGFFYLQGFTMNHFDGRSWRATNNIEQIDEIAVTWPSIFSAYESENEFFESPLTNRELIHQIETLRIERKDLQDEIVALFNLAIETQEDIYDAEILDKQTRLDEVENVLWHSILELNNQYIFTVTQPQRIDLSRTMPAYIAEFYSLSSTGSASVPAEIRIRRTGDMTTNIIYRPYYGRALSEGGDSQGNLHSFYSVRGSVLRLADEVFTSDFTFDINGDELAEFGYPDAQSSLIFFPADILSDVMSSYSEQLRRTRIYTEIDPNTAVGLRQLAYNAGIDPNADRAVVVDAVASYVMSSGLYTLEPELIPEGVDFSVYFLTESQGGYCIHFATAAVMMLRSLDIPARFASGYAVRISPWQIGNIVTVTDRNAHAWVEVFYEDVGWLYLEVTPSSGNPYIPNPSSHTPGSDDDSPAEPDPGSPGGIVDIPEPEEEYNGHDTINGGPAAPAPGNNDGERNPLLPERTRNLIITIVCIVSVIAFTIIRRSTANKIRARNFRQSDTNRAALCMWRYILRISKKENVAPDEIEDLALKARFSQHRLTEEERTFMLNYTKKIAFEICEGKGDLGKFWLRYIRALC